MAAPLIAHLLRRGRAPERAFPATALVPTARALSQKRTRLQDRALFALRAAMIGLCALLGATPLVQCSRLSLTRDSGASVVLAVVIDDSLSMRGSLPTGVTRFERARRGVAELLKSARRGDAVAIVLAGQPARLALAPTTDLDEVERTLEGLAVSDRGTDLAGAVQIARGVIAELPQQDKQLVVLSDFAAETPVEGSPPVWVPLPELAQPLQNCGIADAVEGSRRVEARVSCSSASAAEGRKAQALGTDPDQATKEEVLGEVALSARGGLQSVAIPLPAGREARGVRLTREDAIDHDDAAPVGRGSPSLQVAVQADPTRASAKTGGPTLIEQALEALGQGATIRPLALLPEDPKELAPFAVLVEDDPAGAGPEVRSALEAWVEHGGVALALLGPRAEQVQLGTTLEPFVRGALSFRPTDVPGLDPTTLSWLGPEADGLAKLSPKGRSMLEGTELPGTEIRGRWKDGAAFLLSRELGSGVVLSAGLPSSPETSDLSLRPGFLALLDHALGLARDRAGLRTGLPGILWRFPAEAGTRVLGPEGPVPARPSADASEANQQVYVPELRGRYQIETGGTSEERVVSLDPQEISALPDAPRGSTAAKKNQRGAAYVDVSPNLVIVLVILLGVEIALRAARLMAGARRGARGASRP